MNQETEPSKKIDPRVFLDWAEAFEVGTGITGGKGWNLGRLARYGFKIPAGGVLSVEAYKDFVVENNLQNAIGDIAQKVALNNIGEKETEEKLALLREKIKSARVPAYIQEEIKSGLIKLVLLEKSLAVRSSASAEDSDKASFAGIHESFLNVHGFKNILKAVNGCYASLWTEQAVAYRRKMGIPDNEALMAVVFMEMVQAHAAGVAFSCDPRTGREDVLTIGANFGLGESVVKGLIDPDEYILGSSLSPEIKHRKIGSKKLMTVVSGEGGTKTVKSELYKVQALSDEQIKKLGNLVLRIFEVLGKGELHQDIEWVFDGEECVLVQARPLTALQKVSFAELKDQPEIWSNANIKDAVPMVLPVLSRSAIKNNINEILASPFKIIGYQMPDGLQQVKIYMGRAYLNLSAIQWCNFDALGIYPKETNKNFGGHQPEIAIHEEKPYSGIKGLKRLWRMVKFFRAVAQYKKKANSYFAGVTDFSAAFLKKDLSILADKELFRLSGSIFKAANEFAPVFMMMTGAAASLSMLVKV
ncbi:MAG: pyruvate, phosphate dikinase, partial [Nitrospirae bacterium]